MHLVDLMMWVLGERPATVSAVGNRIATEGTSFRYDDFVAEARKADDAFRASTRVTPP